MFCFLIVLLLLGPAQPQQRSPAPHVFITPVHPALPPPPAEQDNGVLVTLKNLGINFASYLIGAISAYLVIWAYYATIRQNRWAMTDAVRMAIQAERWSRAPPSIPLMSSGSSTVEREIEMTAQRDIELNVESATKGRACCLLGKLCG